MNTIFTILWPLAFMYAAYLYANVIENAITTTIEYLQDRDTRDRQLEEKLRGQ